MTENKREFSRNPHLETDPHGKNYRCMYIMYDLREESTVAYACCVFLVGLVVLPRHVAGWEANCRPLACKL